MMPGLLEDPVTSAIAARVGKSPAEVLPARRDPFDTKVSPIPLSNCLPAPLPA
jgi:hypothetical protein